MTPARKEAIRLWQEGNKHLDEADLTNAKILLTRSIAADPTFWRAHNGMGCCYREEGSYDQALECFQHSLSLAPETHTYLVLGNIGATLHDQGKYASAIDHFRQALELKPDDNDGDLYGLGAAIYMHHGYSTEESLDCWRKAVSLNPAHLDNPFVGAALPDLWADRKWKQSSTVSIPLVLGAIGAGTLAVMGAGSTAANKQLSSSSISQDKQQERI